jgi:prepilin-type N-terminal cleavage/methylation domain-containing protein
MQPRIRLRSGVSVVEVLVALVILSIAAMGSAATIGYSARAQQRAASLRRSLDALRIRAAEMEASACVALANGSTVVDSVAVTWDVEVSPAFARVTLRAAHRGVTSALRTEVPCP